MTCLLIGCGAKRERLLRPDGRDTWPGDLVTLDHNPDHKPDVVHDLEHLPYPFADNQFDEIHAYEVLEHTGAQGDWRFFFSQFAEFHRILKPDGFLCASVPAGNSPWLWADPSHRRAILPETLVFLSQRQYREQVGVTAMSDFRHWYQADFETEFSGHQNGCFYFALRAIKETECPP